MRRYYYGNIAYSYARISCALIGLFAMFSLCGEECVFVPPASWEVVVSAKLDPCIKIGFVKNTLLQFRPSINLAEETISSTPDNYLKEVKRLHNEDPNLKWQKLGTITTLSGEAILAEIDSQTSLGPVKMLQAILFKNKQAYIITGALLKENFSKEKSDILKAIRSMQVVDDPLALVDSQKQAKIRSLEGDLQHLQKYLLKNCKEMGAYWQILILKNAASQKLSPS